MSYVASTLAFESRQYLVTQRLHGISIYERKQVIDPDENDLPAIIANKQSSVTMAAYKVKDTQQLNQHLVPLTCCLLEPIQGLFQPPHLSSVITQLTRLDNVFCFSQHATLKC